MSFSWSASAGQIRSTSWSSTSSEAEWVSPVCFDNDVYITATAIGAYVPTADGSGFVYQAGSGQADGTFIIPGVDRTTLTGSIDYGSSMRNCGNVAARIDPSQGDFLHVTQHVSRKDMDALPTGLTLVEARKGFQVHSLSGSADGGMGDGETADAGTLRISPSPPIRIPARATSP